MIPTLDDFDDEIITDDHSKNDNELSTGLFLF